MIQYVKDFLHISVKHFLHFPCANMMKMKSKQTKAIFHENHRHTISFQIPQSKCLFFRSCERIYSLVYINLVGQCLLKGISFAAFSTLHRHITHKQLKWKWVFFMATHDQFHINGIMHITYRKREREIHALASLYGIIPLGFSPLFFPFTVISSAIFIYNLYKLKL